MSPTYIRLAVDSRFSANSADLEVRRKAINIVLSMTSSRNVEDVVLFLKKQLQKTQEQEYEKVLSVTRHL